MTLSEAKTFFQSSGCSHPNMFRNDPELYNKYRLVSDAENEKEWTQEEIHRLLLLVNNNNTPTKDLWKIHAEIVSLFLNLGSLDTIENIEIILHATRNIKEKLPAEKFLVIAENLIGRKANFVDGALFMVHKFGNKEVFFDLVKICHELLDDSTDIERATEDFTSLNRLMLELS